MRKTIFAAAALALAATPALGVGETPEPPDHDWSFDGIWGTVDAEAARRGFQVYSEVCANCHGIEYVAFRHLADIGFSEDAIKAFAAQRQYDTIADDGSVEQREGLPSDKLSSPYANEKEAAAVNGGVVPPDLTLMVKAREGGADYLYALLTGYREPPEEFWVDDEGNPIPEDQREISGYYNEYFDGHVIAMPPPLSEGIVSYEGEDAPEPTVEQLAEDVTYFLAWTAEPEMEERKNLGVKVILFLIFLTALLYAYKRKVWRNVEH